MTFLIWQNQISLDIENKITLLHFNNVSCSHFHIAKTLSTVFLKKKLTQPSSAQSWRSVEHVQALFLYVHRHQTLPIFIDLFYAKAFLIINCFQTETQQWTLAHIDYLNVELTSAFSSSEPGASLHHSVYFPCSNKPVILANSKIQFLFEHTEYSKACTSRNLPGFYGLLSKTT